MLNTTRFCQVVGEKRKHLFSVCLGSGEAEGRASWDMANEGEEMEKGEHGRGCRSSKKREYFSFVT